MDAEGADGGVGFKMRAANERKSASTNSMREERPYSAALCRASARRVGDVSSAMTMSVRW